MMHLFSLYIARLLVACRDLMAVALAGPVFARDFFPSLTTATPKLMSKYLTRLPPLGVNFDGGEAGMSLVKGTLMNRSWSKKAAKLTIPVAILGLAPAQSLTAQNFPTAPNVISPLQVETNFQGVNLTTGKISVDTPVLRVPGAPRLYFDRVQNLAPYVVGSTQTGAGGEGLYSSYSVHTGRGPSASFSCIDDDCASLSGEGAALVLNGSGGNRTFVYYEAGSGNRWDFDSKHTYIAFQGRETYHNYASKVTFPDGEVITYSYNKHTDPGAGGDRIYHRPINVSSNAGYHITISYHSAQFGVLNWSRPNLVELKNASTSGVVGRQTYSSDGLTITDLLGRVYQCTNCNNQMTLDIEMDHGSLKVPGDTTSSFSATAHASGGVVGSVSRQGISWSYAYTNLQGSFLKRRFDAITVTGPNNITQTYEFQYLSTGNNLKASVDPLGRRTEYVFNARLLPTLVKYPEGNRSEIDYDTFDNVVQKRQIAKAGSGTVTLVTSATYPTSNSTLCNSYYVSPRCFRPITVVDPKGVQSDYQYNDRGQLTQTLTPNDVSQVRAKTVITYGLSPAGISRPETRTLCSEAQNCTSAGISRIEYVYWQNTKLPSKVCTTDLATSSVLVTEYTYDEAGRKLSETQPLGVSGGCT